MMLELHSYQQTKMSHSGFDFTTPAWHAMKETKQLYTEAPVTAKGPIVRV